MTANLVTIEDEIFTRLKAVWTTHADTSGYALAYNNVRQTLASVENGSVPWALADVQTGISIQTAFGDENKARFENRGQLVVSVSSLPGDGKKVAKKMAQVVVNAFRRHRTPSGVVFPADVIIQDVGVVGLWYKMNVIVPYMAEELA